MRLRIRRDKFVDEFVEAPFVLLWLSREKAVDYLLPIKVPLMYASSSCLVAKVQGEDACQPPTVF